VGVTTSADDQHAAPTVAIADRPELERYELTLDGRLAGVATYQLAAEAGRITLIHTEIAPAGRGLGLGSRLAEHVLADIRRRGLRVQADCEFMAGHIATHPEHQDLLG
jgi:uncharacterized protein